MSSNVPSDGQGLFDGIVPELKEIEREGRRTAFQLPQRYFNWSMLLAHFPASAAAITRFLPEGSGLEPVTIAPGLGIVSIGAFDYKECATLEPYFEVGVLFPVRLRPLVSLPALPLLRPDWFGDLAFWVWQLPVTKQDSCDAGRVVWNFPKIVGDITIDVNDAQRRLRCTWVQDGRHVLTLEGRTSSTSPQLREFAAYSVVEGRLRHTRMHTYGDYHERRFGADANFALGQHPIAEQMRELGIFDVAVGTLYSTRAQGVLFGPSPVPLGTAPVASRAPRVLRAIAARTRPRPTRRTVAVIGGGVAGLSAAHELAERGFDVTIYERRAGAGGKARSMGVPESAGESRDELPCEHGFRFFPGFYRHLPDTMARIPHAPTGKTVADNLVAASRLAIDFQGDGQLVFPARFPSSLGDIRTLLGSTALVQERTGCSPAEIALYISKIWQLLTSCEERRLEEYEKEPWWSFIEGGKHSAAYARYLASTTRSLVAADPEQASTRTVGNILLQMLFDLATPGANVDRVLNGPTNEVWIDPWVTHLQTLGVEWKTATATQLLLKGGRLDGIDVVAEEQGNGAKPETIRADFYIVAVPVEVMARLLKASKPAVVADPKLNDIIDLAGDVESMTGIQFYFRESLPLEPGHYMHLDTPWALTSLAQAQFWATDLARYGDGTIRDILSVDISDWNRPGLPNGPAGGKTANNCSRAEIKEEVWAQLRHSLPFLNDVTLATVYLDDAITEYVDPKTHRPRIHNEEPLLVNRAGRWALRPEAATGIPNLFLAGDYVRTYTDLATMEGANEAARRAVNAVLEACGSVDTPCAVWNLHDPPLLAPWRWIDRYRYFSRQPWSSDFPLALRGVELGLDAIRIAASAVTAPRQPATAGQDPNVAPATQKLIGDQIERFMQALEAGDADALKRLFVRGATITIGLRPRRLADARAFVRPGVVVTIQRFKSIYWLGDRVHLRMTVRLQEARPGAGPPVEGHVHVVFVPTEGAGAGDEADRWRIASLRYRAEGKPARRESLTVPAPSPVSASGRRAAR